MPVAPGGVKRARCIASRVVGAAQHPSAPGWLTAPPPGGMRAVMNRLELARVRVCQRCGRGRAELRSEDGRLLTVSLDPARARELSGARAVDDVRSFADFVLAELGATGRTASEVVLDVAHDHLRALVSLVRGGEVEVVGCSAQEGVELAVRGALRLYATDEALAHAAPPPDEHEEPSGPGGPETLH